MRIIRRARQVWRHQDTDSTIQTPVLQNTDYTMFSDLVGWKRLIILVINQINDETDAKSVTVTCTIDGVNYAANLFMSSSNNLWMRRYYAAATLQFSTTPILFMLHESLQCESVEVKMKMTDPPGTNQKMYSSVVYSERVFT